MATSHFVHDEIKGPTQSFLMDLKMCKLGGESFGVFLKFKAWLLVFFVTLFYLVLDAKVIISFNKVDD